MNDQFRVWVIRADYGDSTNAFAENGYIGVGHGMDGVDLSSVTSPEEIRRLFVQEHPDERSEQSIGNRSSQVARFHLEIKSGDYVLTPERDRDWIRYGRFDSDNRYYADEGDGLPHRNRRSVNWSSERLRRDDLPDGLLQGGMTLYEVADTSRKDGFLSLIRTLAKPDVWIVRGGASGASVDYQLENGIAGLGFSLQEIDLSILGTSDDIRRAYTDRHPGASSGSVGHNVASVSNFILDIKINDYVLMPNGDRKRIHCGKVISDPYHVPSGPWKNRRNIEWLNRVATKSDLPSLPDRTRTVVKATDRLKDEVLAWIEKSRTVEFQMPEDSWVPFHLEIGRKLVEGEWWLPEKRDEYDQMIHEIRWADPEDVDEDYEYDRWSGDPYSFYLSFNMRTAGSMRVPGYQKVQDLLEIGTELPDVLHRARGLGVNWGFDPLPNDEEIAALWGLFRRAVEFDPTDYDAQTDFVEAYDRALEFTGSVARWDRVLSYWLYWIDPRKFLLLRRLNRQELGLADELGIPNNVSGGEQYLRVLKATREFAESKGLSLLDINRDTTTREMLGLDPIIGPGDDGYDIDAMLDDGVFLERAELERMVRILRSKKNLILQGPPGVGKTFIARKLAYVLMGSKTEERISSVQFHQSYSYEDFVGGFRPDVGKDGQMVFTRQDGPFLRMCAAARANPDDAYVMLIDEINRGNLSRVFGELLMLIEADKRRPEFAVTLQHRPDVEDMFFVPENVYIIGTMNLADRSLTGMNVAMRRRFGFVDLKPQFNERVFTDWLSDETEMPPDLQARVNTKMKALNDAIAEDPSLGYNYAVGHSFFCPPEGGPVGGWEEWYKTVVDYEIRPLLREYWFDAPDKANEQADTLL